MSKKLLSVSLLISILLIPAFCLAGMFDVLGKKDDSGKVDVKALSQRSADVVGKTQKASISFAEAVVNVQYAVGKKEDAEKLKTTIENAKAKKDDPNATKVLVSEVNNAVTEVNKIDMQAQMDKSKASGFLTDSILNVGAGMLLDTQAADSASTLLKDSQEALKKVSFMAASKVKDIINTSQFIVKEVPPQVSSMQTFSNKLIVYANTNGIPVPTKESMEKKMLAMEKE